MPQHRVMPAQQRLGSDHFTACHVAQFILQVSIIISQHIAQLLKFTVAKAVCQGDSERLV